jgi:RNA polymerase sigma-70 factor (ECF subfamily)
MRDGVSAELAVDYSVHLGADDAPHAAAVAISGRSRFEDILRRHHQMLRRVAAGVLVDHDSLDDVLQDSYLKAYRALPSSFANERHEAAWLYRIVHRTCLDELRRRKRRREQPLSDGLAAHAADSFDVAEALRTLRPDDRLTVLLVDLLGFDYETAAAIVGVPRGTLASRLSAARRRLRDAMGET